MTAQAVITHFKFSLSVMEFQMPRMGSSDSHRTSTAQDIRSSIEKLKALLKHAKTALKAGEDGKDPQLESLVWHNIPSEGFGTSPT